MCGIVGFIGQRNAVPFILQGLEHLEYRGYDSAGIAVITPDHKLERVRVLGKVRKLIDAVYDRPQIGNCAIGHTRWATHGKPCERNAHPHISHGEIALVHNGIIENNEALHNALVSKGYNFESETDSEIIVHLIHYYLQESQDIFFAIQATIAKLEGAFALAVIDLNNPDRMFAVRNGSPLVIGIGEGENFVASDPIALHPEAKKLIYLEDGDFADITQNEIKIYNHEGDRVDREEHVSGFQQTVVDRGEYRHFMSKEIFEQPKAVIDCTEGRLTLADLFSTTFGGEIAGVFKQVKFITIAACGTSYHAGLVARYWIETLTRIPCRVEVASEFRYHKNIVLPDSLFICISQSGETADTLAALREAKQQNYLGTLAICNVPGSSLVRESDFTVYTKAGPEIGVASTKAFTTQLVSMLLITAGLLDQQDKSIQAEVILNQLADLPKLIEDVSSLCPEIESLSKNLVSKHSTLFLGRGALFPVALEGALKLKELSYIHAEAYPAGELKHGPLALIDENMPVIAVAPRDSLLEKIKSNLQEVRARGAHVIVFTDDTSILTASNDTQLIKMPVVEPLISPIVYTIPMQLLAYHVAVHKGTDVDQPRNLAKSVTVE